MAFNKTYLLGFLFFGPFLVNLAILFFSRFIIDFFQWNTDQYTSDILTRAASMGFCLSWVLAGLTIRYSVQRSNSGGDSTYRQYDDLGRNYSLAITFFAPSIGNVLLVFYVDDLSGEVFNRGTLGCLIVSWVLARFTIRYRVFGDHLVEAPVLFFYMLVSAVQFIWHFGYSGTLWYLIAFSALSDILESFTLPDPSGHAQLPFLVLKVTEVTILIRCDPGFSGYKPDKFLKSILDTMNPAFLPSEGFGLLNIERRSEDIIPSESDDLASKV
ncbi:hypothetical protein C8J56DRAFT_1083221 [Mycena floridula]|nr:hypothetical protein C8J56DRAFT_1083221 [Mycena floridula]